MTLQQAMEQAIAQHRAGNLAAAEAIYRQVLEISPNQPDIVHLLGILAIQTGKLDLALDIIRKAIEMNPNEPTYHANLGEALMRLGRVDDAITAFRRSIDLGQVYEAWNNLGNALSQRGKLEEAIDAFRQAIKINPTLPEAHNNLGDALKQAGRLEEAMESIERALAIQPNLMPAHNNRGICLRALGRFDEAIESYRKAISLVPSWPILHYNLAVTLLLKGDFEQGFIEYEHRFGVPEIAASIKRFKTPRWEGEELGGRTILLHAEQGFGDTIQFVRYAPLVKERGGRVMLAVQKELLRLMEGVDGVDEIVALDEAGAGFEIHCPLLSLARIFGTTLESIPSEPYLKVDEQIVQAWAARLPPGAKRKVGLVWSGQTAFRDDLWRSMSLGHLAPLAELPEVEFYSLQVGDAADQVKNAPAGLEVTDLSLHLADFAETAGALMQMNLLITTDTAAAHLAGAMGMPVWLLTAFSPDWRWLLDRQDSPWYPTMRLFRQPALGDWQTPVDEVRAALEAAAD